MAITVVDVLRETFAKAGGNPVDALPGGIRVGLIVQVENVALKGNQIMLLVAESYEA